MPRSVLREPLVAHALASSEFVCLYDSRCVKLPRKLTEREYLSREHVAVSYAGDMRGIIEDVLGKTRKVRVSVAALGHVVDVVDGSPLLATVPSLLAKHAMTTRPHLRCLPLPFSLASATVDLLWLRLTDADEVARFVRSLILNAKASLEPKLAPRTTARSKTS
jgi:LysR family transcriptional regulator, mexEF-oprN operon transcriptional activator